MKKIIILIVILLVVSAIVFFAIKKNAVKKMEYKTFGNMSKAEFKDNLQKAWKERYFLTNTRDLLSGEGWAKDWHQQLVDNLKGDETLEDAVLKAVQWAWSGNPKANDNDWSKGWLTEIHVKQNLKLNPIPEEAWPIINTI